MSASYVAANYAEAYMAELSYNPQPATLEDFVLTAMDGPCDIGPAPLGGTVRAEWCPYSEAVMIKATRRALAKLGVSVAPAAG